jgi:hypothetical protein
VAREWSWWCSGVLQDEEKHGRHEGEHEDLDGMVGLLVRFLQWIKEVTRAVAAAVVFG